MNDRENIEGENFFRILFVCHGNICRSRIYYEVFEAGRSKDFLISSAAATTDDIGAPNAKSELKKHGIPFERIQARQIKSSDYKDWDYIIAMDEENLNNIVAHDSEKKVRLLMSFTGEERGERCLRPVVHRRFSQGI